MATAKSSEFDIVTGLDSGADDYLSKPFGMMEMVSHIKAVLRRSQVKQTSVLISGQLSMDTVKHTVHAGNKQVFLTLKEFEILKLLMEYPGQVFTREALLSSVWGINYEGETRTVDVHIGTLRTKLEEYGKMIETVRGVGYRMIQDNEK
nr:response regulator transcription factor [Sphaerochaetaceae bacterium]